ncbi:MAG: GntR family transcriptional regulator [Rhizobiales bacterium]|nr:GntR family transcriptional regulator [Hyphomicrobiales bacterium]
MDDGLIPELNEKIWPSGARRDDLVQRVTNALREQILSGRLAPGARLAPETELARWLGISRPTLREAIRVLARESLVAVKHGVGSFVAREPKPMLISLEVMRSMTDFIRASGSEPGVRDLSMQLVDAPADAAKLLEIEAGSPVARISRVRLAGGAPFAIANEYLKLDSPERDLSRIEAFEGGSLFEFLRVHCGKPISHSRLWMSATSADGAMAKVLGLKPHAPLLLMREIHFDFQHRPMLYSVNFHNTDVLECTSVRSGLPR